MTNNDDTPTTPLDDARDPGPAPEPSTRPASENPAPKRSVARPLLIGAAAGVGVLLLGGLGALAVDALTDGRDVETVPAAEVGPDGSGQTTGDADASRPDDGGQSDDAVGPNQTPGSPLAERGEPAALVEAIDRAVAMVNIDMVGRLRNDPGLLVGGVGSSPQWMELFEHAGWDGIPITFDRSITTRSDQASFYKLGMPVVFMFTGVHADYHAPGDEAAAIDAEGLRKIAGLTLGVVEQIADGSAIDFSEPATPEEGLVPALPGDNEATIERRVGYPGSTE